MTLYICIQVVEELGQLGQLAEMEVNNSKTYWCLV